MRVLSWNVNGLRAAQNKGFSRWLSRSGADIVGIQEVRAQVPYAQICFDPFHVVKLANEACSEVRRTEARVRKGTPHAAVLKGSRWTLLRAPENLRDYEHVRLAEVAALNHRARTGEGQRVDHRLGPLAGDDVAHPALGARRP